MKWANLFGEWAAAKSDQAAIESIRGVLNAHSWVDRRTEHRLGLVTIIGESKCGGGECKISERVQVSCEQFESEIEELEIVMLSHAMQRQLCC